MWTGVKIIWNDHYFVFNMNVGIDGALMGAEDGGEFALALSLEALYHNRSALEVDLCPQFIDEKIFEFLLEK